MEPTQNVRLTNLVLIRKNGQVLLAMKKRGFGVGRYNGFGGKVQPGEEIEASAVRETQEEGGITPKNLRKFATMTFSFENDPLTIVSHCFTTDTWEGDPMETEEMKPEWFPEMAAPFDRMWPDDQHWFPLFLAGETFTARFHFSQDQKTILHKEITVV